MAVLPTVHPTRHDHETLFDLNARPLLLLGPARTASAQDRYTTATPIRAITALASRATNLRSLPDDVVLRHRSAAQGGGWAPEPNTITPSRKQHEKPDPSSVQASESGSTFHIHEGSLYG